MMKNSIPSWILHVSAACGTGKTYGTSDHIAANRDISNYLYVGPTTKFLKEAQATLEAKDVKATLITSETHENCVQRTIIKHLNGAGPTGHVLLITQQAFLDLRYFRNRGSWEVIIDEIPQLDRLHRLEMPLHKDLLAKYLRFERGSGDELYTVRPACPDEIERLLEQPHDDVLAVFRPLLKDLVSGNRRVFADQDTFDKLNGRILHKRGKDAENRIYFLSVLEPGVFENATILGANVEHSLLYHWCRARGYEFRENGEIARRLRKLPPIGDRLEIGFFVPGRHFSKYLRDNKIDGRALIDHMDELAYEKLGHEPFLRATNKDRAELRAGWVNAIPIPVVSHGLNAYAGVHAIYFSAALNREPKHYRLLEALGLTAEMIDKSTGHEIIYQGVMRTSLRDPDSTRKVIAIVPDELSARTLSALTMCDEVAQVGNLIGSKQAPLTSNQKANRAKARKIMDRYFPNTAPESYSIKDNGIDSGKFPMGAHSYPCVATFHETAYAKTADEHLINKSNIQEWINDLRAFSRAVVETKDEVPLFVSALFDPPEGADGYRRKEYFVFSSFMVLDFDGKQVSPDIFDEIFWSKAKWGTKSSFVMCNTFSRSPEKPNKFRVFMFYKRPVLSIEEHQAVFDWIERRLEEAGYPKETSGLDRPACRSGVQPFYLPCTNRAHQASAFFTKRGTKTEELKRCALDPEAIWAGAPRNGAPWHGGSRMAYSSEAIEEEIRKLRSMEDGRRPVFFQIGVMYAGQGLSCAQVERALREVAGSDERLLEKIPDVIKSLKRYGRLK